MNDDTNAAQWHEQELNERRRRDDELMAGRPEYSSNGERLQIGQKVRFVFADQEKLVGTYLGCDAGVYWIKTDWCEYGIKNFHYFHTYKEQ